MTREQFNEKYAWAYDAMRDGKKCKFWDKDKDNCIYGVIDTLAHEQDYPFGCLEEGDVHKNCELVKTEKWIKQPEEAMELLFENEYKLNSFGFIENGPDIIVPDMLKLFGTKLEEKSISYTWPDFLIEEKEVIK